MVAAVVFDMDGVLVDSEQVWDEVRAQLVADWGGRYTAEIQQAMMGMSSPEWSRFLAQEAGLTASPAEINDEVVRRMLERYGQAPPLIEGAVEAVRRLAAVFPLGLASSSNRPLIDTVLARAGITACFSTTVSSEEVGRGKPSPDVYLEAARRLGTEPSRCAAIEDSTSGIHAAHAAGMYVVAYPNRHYPPAADALALADAVVDDLDQLDAALLRR